MPAAIVRLGERVVNGEPPLRLTLGARATATGGEVFQVKCEFLCLHAHLVYQHGGRNNLVGIDIVDALSH